MTKHYDEIVCDMIDINDFIATVQKESFGTAMREARTIVNFLMEDVVSRDGGYVSAAMENDVNVCVEWIRHELVEEFA